MDSESIDTLVADALEGTTADPGVGAKALTNPHGLSDYDEGFLEGVRVTHATVMMLLNRGTLRSRDGHSVARAAQIVHDWLGWSLRHLKGQRVHGAVAIEFPNGHAPGLDARPLTLND